MFGQQLGIAAIQEGDSLSRKLDYERHQATAMKQENKYLATTLSQERQHFAKVEQEKLNLETILLEKSEELKISLSKLKNLEAKHVMLEESLHQASEIRSENEVMIEKLGIDLSTANTEVRIIILM